VNSLAKTKKIGRFEVLRVLGEGAQGTVYLANDPHLQRRVAIKTVLFEPGQDRARQINVLLDEARIVSQMQHGNIASLFDAGEHDGQPYLVFEYLEGTTLAQLIRREGKLPVAKAVDIAAQILDGVAYAHGKQVIHRDLKPSNIMIDRHGVPRIMDFGIAKSLASDRVDEQLEGTPLYMAPEFILEKTAVPQSDLFSLGMILYEMLVGRHPIKAGSVNEVLDRIVHQTIAPPSASNPEIDEKLDSIVLKALAKKPGERYESAVLMAEALRNYMEPEIEPLSASEGAQSTLEFLLRRMRHKSDFPALSQAISAVNRIAASENESVPAFSNVILKDFALTNKLLKMVNTAFYGQFGGTISTISRAVVILGFETVRSIAISLMLFEHLQNKAQAAQLKDEIIASFFSGVVARDIASKHSIRDTEEAFICSMFHNLGRLLSTFYFHEESLEINKMMQGSGVTEAKASAAVLGVTYEELGIEIAKAWNFPDRMVSSMRRFAEEKIKPPKTETDKVRILSSLANELSEIAGSGSPAEKGRRLKELSGRYGDSIRLSETQLASVIESSLAEFSREATILEINPRQSAFMKRVSEWSDNRAGKRAESVRKGEEDTPSNVLADVLEKTMLRTNGSEDGAGSADSVDADAILAAGIQDITNTLVEQYSLNDMLRMILETMYRAMNFSRVFICIKDGKTGMMNARFGFGENIDQVLKTFRFPMKYEPDVFHAALAQGVDIHIADIDAEAIRARVPKWYRQVIKASSFILFPIVIDKVAIGLLYADKTTHNQLNISSKQLNLLKTLRNQAVLAIKQKL
jgi:serine/threonine protein kinase